MNKWLAVGLVFGVVGSLSAGCSSAAPPISLDDFCNEKAQAECQYVVPVCAGDSVSACVSTQTTACLTDASKATETGTRVFNSNNVPACIAAINSTFSALKFGMNTTLAYSGIDVNAGTGTVDYLCESVFQGDVEANEQCTSDFDCVNNNVCAPGNGGDPTNVCAPLNSVAQGASCGSAGSVCQPGNACVKSSNGEYLCEPSPSAQGGQGAACKSDNDCNPNTAGYCDPNVTDSNGSSTCQLGYSFGCSGKNCDCSAYGG
jgi:hypothetical protein